MSNLVQTLLQTIEGELSSKIGASDDSQYRGAFFAPPTEILAELLQAAIASGGLDVGSAGGRMNPVLLPSRQCDDPRDLSTSGRCTDSHLVKVRTSECRRFLILLPPGHPMNESMETTIQQMGIPPSESRRAYRTPFYERLLSKAIEVRHGSSSEAYLEVARGVLRSELVKLDEESQDGTHQWRLLQNLFDREVEGATSHDSLIAVMGLFSCDSDQVVFKDHQNVLQRLADLLESMGIRQGFEILKERAPEHSEPLDKCMQHIRSHCHSGSDFKESPASLYSPLRGIGKGQEIPDWWSQLTLDTWMVLLETAQAKATKDLNVSCTNAVVPISKGLPPVVQSEPRFQVTHVNPEDGRRVRISRGVGRKPAEEMGTHEIPAGGLDWEDSFPPDHPSHLEYTFEVVNAGGEESKPIKVKVIALDTYEVGLVAYCRNAAKITPFKARKKKKTARKIAKKKVAKKGGASSASPTDFESSLEVHGMGMHQIDLYTASNLILDKEMTGFEVSSEKDLEVSKPINSSGDRHAVSVIETDEECKYLFQAGRAGQVRNNYWIHIEADDEAPVGADSEFDRLVIEHQKKISGERSGATIEPPGARCSDLQRWMLQNEHSYRPLVIGPDFEEQWTEPDWIEDAILSERSLLQDPRPSWQDLAPPEEFLKLRRKVLGRIGKDAEGGSRLLEEVNLGDLMKEEGEDGFASLIERFVSVYAGWLRDNYESAAWCDVVLACKADSGGGSLNPNPYAILLSPLHPLRLAWHCQAHRILKEALDQQVPCPAASTLDPSTFPIA